MVRGHGFGDRRQSTRFDVLGRLAVSVLSTESLRLVNLGTVGALVEGAVPLLLETLHTMRIVYEEDVSDVTVRVRRVTPIAAAPLPPRYVMALEFVRLSPAALELITKLVVASGVEN
ncbi:MAG TPA: hypothetical protein VFX12_00815 [Vicinamibacterales bacterium]|nr:hypothetical protein [Vicinamibacterales bacterium]